MRVKELTLEARLANLQQVLDFVDDQLRSMHCPMKLMMQIDVAVEEIFVNVASYAYAPGTGSVTVRTDLQESPRAALITFIDSGVPFNPLAKQDPDVTLSAEERSIGGLGIYMVKKTMDKMDYAYENGQNILTMKNLYHEGDYTRLGEYIDEYYDSLPSPETKQYCQNSALNALLNFYAGKAKENGIRASFRIDIPRKISVSDVDLCTIIGNILENAIAACMDLPEEERMLSLSGLVQNHRLYIVATNTFNGIIRQWNGEYLSLRHSGNGIGLNSVRASAEKYHGKAEFSHNEKEFHSNVLLVLE